MENERSNTGNQPNDQRNRSGGGSTQSPSTSTPTRPENDRYAEGTPDSSRQFGEAGRSPRSNQGQSGPVAGSGTHNLPGGSGGSRKPMPSTGQTPSDTSGSSETDAEAPETGVNETSRQPEAGKRNPVSGGRRSDESGSA